MQILEILAPLAFLFASLGLASADGSAPTVTAGPVAPTVPPEVLRAPLPPVTVNPDITFERIANTIPQTVCDTDNNHYENLTGTRGDGDGYLFDCLALDGWLRDDANYGRFIVRGGAWDPTGEHYVDLLWTDHCAFGAFRADFQQEDLYIGGHDVAALIETSVKWYPAPGTGIWKVETDGFLYCGVDIPVGWGLYNKFASEQWQWDDD